MTENSAYLTDQLITCIGNKRALLGPISGAIESVRSRLGKKRLRMLDAFSGSGVVSRLMKRHASAIVANDIEDYAAAISACHLTNARDVRFEELRESVARWNERVRMEDQPAGFIERLYAPADETRIGPADRVFYTRANARRIDVYRRLLQAAGGDTERLLLGPLLAGASVHTNTAGVFKSFYKDRARGVGQFGGTGRDALNRILGAIRLEVPVLSRFECDYEIYQEDACHLVERIGDFDLAYLDPPYNEHPYGSNYFMLNLIASYREPERVSRVSGIPAHWRRSLFNSRRCAQEALRRLVAAVDARYLLVSFSSEGIIAPEALRAILEQRGRVEVIRIPYNAFRASRNLGGRDVHVTEYLFLVEVGAEAARVLR